ncbi:hypothetical protein P175DRAFT_0483076 [Aspergillus ochraceoroseus IBT 24754]|uniref:Gag1-like clamp domain-containing protein n=1 Tax=Aspergillus ochraceoroseus IBT 24754 TaxID=1392256 RepID=A0A2T5LTE3_9EURO|nr:uncharacterized protein P175DRAFT_0483076 [Aspergillus ochraceoroseus IBT 24754]PTU19552.1 hypothetical protein P175DRAFT_0483076 [Aspergillus ochraceoroseus IBT 24754]
MSTDSRDEAIREAKRYVRDTVRNDWSFEFSTKPGAPPPTYPASPDPTDVLEWRLREYDSSGSELEPQLSPTVGPVPYGRLPSPLTASSSSSEARRTERRRKRRRQMEEEMSWNEGLRTWVERRDAWSGARSREQTRALEQKDQSDPTSSSELETPTADTDIASDASQPIPGPGPGEPSNLVSRMENALKIAEKEENGANASHQDHDGEGQSTMASPSAAIPASTPTTTPTTSTTIPTPSSANAAPTPPISPLEDFEDPLIPVVPSLISTSNPIRASITPAMYPSIYSKVVIQGLTPTVPINLADMTQAMVQGWKADGQWPPKPTSIVLPDDSMVRTTKHPDTPAIPSTADKPPSSPESKRKSGIASTVRKVLHFSGFHPHPFHRRGSSSQSHPRPEDLAAMGATNADPAEHK